MEEIHVLRATVRFAFTTDGESVAMRLNLHCLGIDPGERHSTVVLAAVGIHIGFHSRALCSLTQKRPVVHHASKDLIEIPSEVEQIPKEIITWNKVVHDIPPDRAFLPLEERACMAEVAEATSQPDAVFIIFY